MPFKKSLIVKLVPYSKQMIMNGLLADLAALVGNINKAEPKIAI